MRIKSITPARQKLIDNKEKSRLEVGESVYVKKSALGYEGKSAKGEYLCTIEDLNPLTVSIDEYGLGKNAYKIKRTDIVSRNIRAIGANPFETRHDHIRMVAYTLESILFGLDIMGEKTETHEAVGARYKVQGIPVPECNWNPYVYDKEGKKNYYQRDFVWTVQDKQLLIESIYQGIDCGKILVRKRGFSELEAMAKKGEIELYFHDIVDGKQRLNAIRGFLMGEFADMHGNYFGDLSYQAQHKLTDNQLFSYAEMPENSKDEDVIYQFLKLNFAGVPQSKEHIEYVKEIHKKM